MKRRIYYVTACLVCALFAGMTPTLSSATCIMDDSGAVFNFDILIDGRITGTIEVPGTCPQGPLVGASVQALQGQTEIGFSVYFNPVTTGCLPYATLSASIDANLVGTGELLRFRRDGSVSAAEVTLTPCNSTTAQRNTTGSPIQSPSSWLDVH